MAHPLIRTTEVLLDKASQRKDLTVDDGDRVETLMQKLQAEDIESAIEDRLHTLYQEAYYLANPLPNVTVWAEDNGPAIEADRLAAEQKAAIEQEHQDNG